MFIQRYVELLLILFFSFTIELQSNGKEIPSPRRLFKNGNLILSAMFPITVSQNRNETILGKYECTLFKLGVFLVEAFLYAIKKANEEDMLKGIKLGYDIQDTCSRVDQSVKTALEINKRVQNELQLSTMNESYTGPRKVDVVNKHIAVIGAGKSELSITVNNILNAQEIPQVSYASTSQLLSNKDRFPTFSRTIPTDMLQAKVIAKVLSQFEWTYATLVYSDDSYGRPLAASLLSYSDSKGICFADVIKLRDQISNRELAGLVNKIKVHPNAKVIVVFLSSINSKRLIEMALSNNIPKKIWIFTATWYNSRELFLENASYLDSSIGVIDEIISVPEFDLYFKSRKNIWLQKPASAWWKLNQMKNKFFSKITGANATVSKHLQFKFGGETLAPHVVNAVFAVVNAINKFCNNEDIDKRSRLKSECQRLIKPSSILQFLRNVSFKGVNDCEIFLNEDGDPINYNIELYSFQLRGNNTQHIRVGVYEGLQDRLTIFLDKFEWKGRKTPPVSKCSLPCPKGFYRVTSVISSCCWQCIQCPAGTFNDESNAEKCRVCLEGTKPDRNQTHCVYISYKYLKWTDPWAIFISVSSVLSGILALFFLALFVYFRRTPVVRASDREFSLLLLLSLAIGLSLPIMYLGLPTDFRCRLQDVLPGVFYTLTLSLTVAKTNRTALIFNIKRSSSMQKFFVQKSVQFSFVVFLTSTQLVVCLLWLSSRPPLAKEKKFPDYRHLFCDFNSVVYFLLSKAILLLLSFACVWMSLSSRHIPCIYNNARHTLFALMTFKITWLIGIVGRFYGDSGPIIDSLTILISYSSLLLLMFSTKIYILLFRNNLNNPRAFRERAWIFTLKNQAAAFGSLQFSNSQMDKTFAKNELVTILDFSRRDKCVQTDEVSFLSGDTHDEVTDPVSRSRSPMYH